MCQLLAISSTVPTPIFSSSLLFPFVQRGGNTDIHSHGWGVAYSNYCSHQKKHIMKTIRDASPAATSSRVESLIMNESQEKILETQTLLAHIRYATVGEVCIDNVHPFHRELFGIEFVFAHNGDVPMFYRSDFNRENLNGNEEKNNMKYEPVGSTDSERIFCYILNTLHSKFDAFPPLNELYHEIHQLCSKIVEEEGVILNFLLGVGEHIFAYSWPGRRPGSKTWNGLYYMFESKDDFSHHDSLTNLGFTIDKAQVAVIATKPLGNDSSMWIEFKKGELLLFSNGTMSNLLLDCR